SQAVMERIGMVRAPESFPHPNVSADSPLSQHCWYYLTSHQWHSR
ncbi:GNAT family N-acetyltransferase, partial [Yersinia enterocolitica]|nr:GNAT family N-acetyltransferase [Yersinia enterocolitica]